MIESLALHGVRAADLVPALMTTHTVANPEYDPAEARRQAEEEVLQAAQDHDDKSEDSDGETLVEPAALETPTPTQAPAPEPAPPVPAPAPAPAPATNFHTTEKVFVSPVQASMPGVTTSLSAADKNVTLDIRWTILCDLFLVLIADSVYDARSRVLLENVAFKLGLGWLDVVKFERRVTEALEIQEGVEKMENQELIDGRQKAARKKRYVMMGLATLGAHAICPSPFCFFLRRNDAGGGLVIG